MTTQTICSLLIKINKEKIQQANGTSNIQPDGMPIVL